MLRPNFLAPHPMQDQLPPWFHHAKHWPSWSWTLWSWAPQRSAPARSGPALSHQCVACPSIWTLYKQPSKLIHSPICPRRGPDRRGEPRASNSAETPWAGQTVWRLSRLTALRLPGIFWTKAFGLSLLCQKQIPWTWSTPQVTWDGWVENQLSSFHKNSCTKRLHHLELQP